MPSSCGQNNCKHCPAVPRGEGEPSPTPAPLSPDEVFPEASRTTADQRQEATPVLMDSDGLLCFIYFFFYFSNGLLQTQSTSNFQPTPHPGHVHYRVSDSATPQGPFPPLRQHVPPGLRHKPGSPSKNQRRALAPESTDLDLNATGAHPRARGFC